MALPIAAIAKVAKIAVKGAMKKIKKKKKTGMIEELPGTTTRSPNKWI